MVKNKRKGRSSGARPMGRYIQTAEEMEARNRQAVKDGRKIRGVNDEEDEEDSFEADLENLINDEPEENFDELADLTKKLRGIGTVFKKERTSVLALIDVENPNKTRKGPSFVKAGDIDSLEPQKLSRREREHLEEIERKRELARATAAGETAEAKADLARLEAIREERARAKERREEEQKKKDQLKARAAKRAEMLSNKLKNKGKKGKKGKKKR